MYDPLAGCGSLRARAARKNTVINLAAVPSSANSRAFSQLLELGKLNDLVSELTSAEEEERRRRRTPQLRENETAKTEEEVTVVAAEAESAAKSETKKAAACDVEQKSVEGGFKRQNQVRA